MKNTHHKLSLHFTRCTVLLQSLPCVRVFHLSLYTASFLTAIGMRYYHVPIAHRSKAWLSLYYFGLQPIVLESWITSLTLLRNACYHHSIVEDKVSSIMPVSPRRIAHSANRPTSYTLGALAMDIRTGYSVHVLYD